MDDFSKGLKVLFEGDYPGMKTIFNRVISPVLGPLGNIKGVFVDGIDRLEGSGKDYIKAFHVITQTRGTFPITIMDVELRDNINIRRNKVAIQKCVKEFVQQSAQAALTFFHYTNTAGKMWRVTYAYYGSKSSENTSATHYTYLCGKGNHSRTIATRFTQIISDIKSPSYNGDLHSVLEDAFSVEALSKEFFDYYKAFYEDIVQYITGTRYIEDKSKKKTYIEVKIHSPNKKIFSEFLLHSAGDEELAKKAVRDYVKKLLGRVVFLCYLEKKGYLCGNKNFLMDLFNNSSEGEKEDYLEKVLEPLFFGVLNTR